MFQVVGGEADTDHEELDSDENMNSSDGSAENISVGPESEGHVEDPDEGHSSDSADEIYEVAVCLADN